MPIRERFPARPGLGAGFLLNASQLMVPGR